MDSHSSARLSWLNSIQVHMFALSIGVIFALTILSLAILSMIDLPPYGRSIRIYEMARLLQNRPLARPPGELIYSHQSSLPQGSKTELEQFLTGQLATRLGRTKADVRLSLPGAGPGADLVKREVELYGPDRAADPAVWNTFSIAVREGPTWRVITRPTADTAWRPTLWYSLVLGFLLILPLTFWFSGRFSRPIKVFAAAAQRMRGNQAVEPIELVGPSEIRLAAQSLNEMHSRVLRFVQERTTLTGAIAHDLRAPLTRLQFHLASVPEPVRESVEGEIREMERMIETVLAFVENEVRSLTREPIDLSMLIEGVVDDFADRGHDVCVVQTEPITGFGDPMLLKRLLVNLIGNGVKYGPSVKVTISREGADAVITVRDNGKGMSEEELARAFDPFFRGEPSRNRSTGGVGLGLSIVEAAAIAHGGSVRLANGDSGGLTATLTLPLANVE